MDNCKEHSGMCQNVENLKENCTQHRVGFDKKLDKLHDEFRFVRNLVITTLITILVQLGFFILNNATTFFAFIR